MGLQSRVVVRGENKGDGKALKFKVLNFTFRVKGWGDSHRSGKGRPGFPMCANLFINFGRRRVARGVGGFACLAGFGNQGAYVGNSTIPHFQQKNNEKMRK